MAIRAVRVSGRSTEMKCDKCEFILDDDTANKAMGVMRVDTIDAVGEKVSAFINFVDDSYKIFHSWYCLKKFNTWDDMITHDKKYHKKGDKMLGMIPSGFEMGYTPTCGD